MQLFEHKRTSSLFKKMTTEGGYYSETDMKKPVAEGGLGLDASNT